MGLSTPVWSQTKTNAKVEKIRQQIIEAYKAKNYPEIFRLCETIPDNQMAQRILGTLYLNGEGGRQDYTKAVYWFQKAAEKGDEVSQYNLGLLYMNGDGVPMNEYKAIEWLTKSANQGNTQAMYNIGWIYLNGGPIAEGQAFSPSAKPNFKEAHKWIKMAADKGDVQAKQLLPNIPDE